MCDLKHCQSYPTISSILTWFERAKPYPTDRDLAVQIGVHFEEVSEMLETLGYSVEQLEMLADKFKQGRIRVRNNYEGAISSHRIALLDALCDQIVTALGVGYMIGFDMERALNEVNRSNWSKFKDGVPCFDVNGKIIKGEGYAPPDLEDCINMKWSK